MKKTLIGSVLCLAILASCSKDVSTFQNPASKADGKIQNSFSIVENVPLTQDLKADKARITISKSALEKEFLLNANVVQQVPAQMFNGMQSRIVSFRQVENKIYLLEAAKGVVAQKGTQPDLVIAEFPIVHETPDQITFDYNAGMSRILTVSDWRYRDDVGEASGSPTSKVEFSYIDRAVFSKTNVLEIHQVANIELKGVSGNTYYSSVRVVYYLKPYSPDPSFVPTKAPRDMRNMGFFEVAPVFTDESGTANYASKHNLSRPIVYAISANTPENFKAAIRDGILYWNKAFGKEVVQVIEAPAGVSAPTSEYNMVQWVDWDSAGFAYADAQMDPRTGEILHQQIFMTSAFAELGKMLTRDFLRENIKAQAEKRLRVGLAGFKPQHLCDHSAHDIATADFLQLLDVEKDEARLLKASQDFVREIMAHEVGHTLGLRHNFAGSTAANYDIYERNQLFKDYLQSGNARPDLVTTSSVMEYSAVLESMMNGDLISKLSTAADYDTKAIQSLYYEKKFRTEELPLFCTDSQVRSYLDCERGDIGNSFVRGSHYTIHKALEDVPTLLLGSFIYAKTPLYGAEVLPLEEVELDAKSTALNSAVSEATFLNILKPNARLLRIERQFPYANSSNEKLVRAKFLEVVLAEINKNGGFEGITLQSTFETSTVLEQKFEAMLQNPRYMKGIGFNGKPYEFSAGEIELMRARAKEFFAAFRLELVKADVNVLAGMEISFAGPTEPSKHKFAADALAEVYGDFLTKRLNYYVFTKTGDPLVYIKNTTTEWSAKTDPQQPLPEQQKTAITLTLPQFKYPLEVRKVASTFLSSSRAEALDWMLLQKLKAKTDYTSMVTAAIGGPLPADDSALSAYPRPAILWMLEAREVQQGLNR